MRRAALLLPLALAACATPAQNMTRARALEPGQVELGGSLGVFVAEEEEREGFDDASGAAAPDLGFRARFGLADGVDLGVTATSSFWFYIRVDAKLQLVDTAAFALALDPSIGSYPLLSASAAPVVELRVPLLMDIELGGGVALVLGPSYTTGPYIEGDGDVRFEHAVGGSVGVWIPITETVRLLPEVQILAPLGPSHRVLVFGFSAGLGALL